MVAVAWIGLGAMGSRMAMRLAAGGHDVTVWNRNRDRAEALARDNAVRIAATPAEAAANAEVVGLMVTDAAAVGEVVRRPDGVVNGIRHRSTVIDFSTVGPAAVVALAADLPSGVALLDSPVLGSLAEATAGTLKLLVGGPADILDRCRPVLSPLGEVRHVGALGSGAAAKLVANFALLGSVTLLGEALALADALGMDRDSAWDLLETTPLAAQAGRRRPAIEDGSYPPRFPLRLARKDAELIDSSGLDLRIGRALAGWFADAAADGHADLDYTAVLSHILAAGRSAGNAA